MSPVDNRVYFDAFPPPPDPISIIPPAFQDPWGGKCPAPWTNILLKDNQTKQAKDLKVGDLVHTQHEETLEWGDYPVEAVKIIPDQKRLSFVFDDGVELVCSLSHKFYLNNTWVEAKDIKVNDILTNKKVSEVNSYEDGDVVLITITDAHTYISEGILSHNKSLAPQKPSLATSPTPQNQNFNPLNSDGYLSGGFGEAYKLNPTTNQYEKYEVFTGINGGSTYRPTGQVIGQDQYDQMYNQSSQALQRQQNERQQRQGGSLFNQFFGGNPVQNPSQQGMAALPPSQFAPQGFNNQFNPNISAGSSTPSTGAILGGLGATALGGAFGGASGASGVLGGLFDLYGSYQQSKANQNINQGLAQGYGNLANQLQSQVQFKPFTVTGTTGGVGTGYDAQGNLQTQYNLGPQGQAIQQAGLGGAGQFLGQAGNIDPTLAAQRGTLGQFFGAQAQQLGQPTGIEGLTSQAIAGGQQRIGQAGQPADINLLRGQFAGQVGGYLGQQPSAQLGQLGAQAYGMGQQALGQSPFMGAGATNIGLNLAQQGAGMLSAGVPDTGIGRFGTEALGMGTQGLRQLSQPADIEALRQQYAGLAGQAAGGLLTGTGDREQQIFERIRAAQTPEEQRQRLATEERMAAQGRLGLSSAAYGGSTPELMAQETAIAEARNRAALGAMDQARAEQAQQLQTAQTLGGLTSQFAGQSSDLQSAAQQRASQLSQLGMSASQIQSQLESEGLGRGLQTLQGGLQAQEIGSGLQTQAQQRAAQLSQLGMSAEQIQSQLQSEGLGRATQAGGMAADLASTASGLETQALQRGLSLAGLGMQGTELGQGLTNQQLQNLLALQQAGQTSALAQQQLQAGNVDIGRGLLAAGLAPESQLLNLIQPSINIASLQGTGQREGANLAAQMYIAQMQAQANAAQAEANRRAQLSGTAGTLLTGQQGGGPSIVEQILGGLFGGSFGGKQPDWIKDVYNTPQTTTNQPNPDIYGMA